MGRRQVVRHRVLIPTFGGSNPSAPVNVFNSRLAAYKTFGFVRSLSFALSRVTKAQKLNYWATRVAKPSL